jgi:hypothetical protein
MGRPPEAYAAPGSHRGRVGIRRLCRESHGGGSTGNRRGAPGQRALRRRAGASSYAFGEASWTQSPPDWIAVHFNMLAFIGGVPRQIVSDNLRAGVIRACFYEPLANRTYADTASHYGTAVIPAWPHKPCDKAKVEVGVQVVRRWTLARLRNCRFVSLTEPNQAIREMVDQMTDRCNPAWKRSRRRSPKPMPRRRSRAAQEQCRQPASQPRRTARLPDADRGVARGSSPGIAIMINVPVGARVFLAARPTDFRKGAHSGASAEKTGVGKRSGCGETAIAAGGWSGCGLQASDRASAGLRGRPSAAALPTSKPRQVDRLCVDHALLTGAVPDRPIGSNRA